MEYIDDYIPIPKEFWSFESGKPFESCSLCGGNLLAEGCNYFIEKAFVKKETIFEYALCNACRIHFSNELSAQSRKLIQHYFEERVDFENRRETLLEKCGLDSVKWEAHCIVKGHPINECEEYQLYGQFIDKDMVFSGFPYTLCGEAIDEIVDLLSAETLGAINDFSKKIFGINLPRGLLLI